MGLVNSLHFPTHSLELVVACTWRPRSPAVLACRPAACTLPANFPAVDPGIGLVRVPVSGVLRNVQGFFPPTVRGVHTPAPAGPKYRWAEHTGAIDGHTPVAGSPATERECGAGEARCEPIALRHNLEQMSDERMACTEDCVGECETRMGRPWHALGIAGSWDQIAIPGSLRPT